MKGDIILLPFLIKKKVPVYRDFLSFRYRQANNTILLESRRGTKKVIKVKECVVRLHFCS